MIEAGSQNQETQEKGLCQRRMLDLLIEASDPLCLNHRINAIQVELQGAAKRVCQNEGLRDGVVYALASTYVKIITEKPDRLPSLFPFFASLCSSKDIGWSLLSDFEAEQERKVK